MTHTIPGLTDEKLREGSRLVMDAVGQELAAILVADDEEGRLAAASALASAVFAETVRFVRSALLAQLTEAGLAVDIQHGEGPASARQ
jgi:hypothetical protein